MSAVFSKLHSSEPMWNSPLTRTQLVSILIPSTLPHTRVPFMVKLRSRGIGVSRRIFLSIKYNKSDIHKKSTSSPSGDLEVKSLALQGAESFVNRNFEKINCILFFSALQITLPNMNVVISLIYFTTIIVGNDGAMTDQHI